MRLLVVLLFAGVIYASAQLVFVGKKPDPSYCANVEQITPNLHLSNEVHLKGRVSDPAGAPLKDSRIELRNYVSDSAQLLFTIETTNEAGEFDLRQVPKGDYRLLASPTRAFQQPADLQCGPKKECFLKIALKRNRTDMPESHCPIR